MTKTTDAQLEVLSHHYSETFELLKSDVAKRDRLFLYIVIVIFILLLYMSAPTAMSDLLNNFLSSQTGGEENQIIDVSFIGAILLLGLLSLSHTYFQTVLHVERQYKYVYHLEKLLSKDFDNKAFIREGEFYQKHRRMFSKWTKAIFWWLFPFLFLLFNVIWLIFLFRISEAPFAYKIIDTVISASIFTSLGFYLLALIKQK